MFDQMLRPALRRVWLASPFPHSTGCRREVLLTLLTFLSRQLLLTLQSKPAGIFFTISILSVKAQHEGRTLQIRVSDTAEQSQGQTSWRCQQRSDPSRITRQEAHWSGILEDVNMCCKKSALA